MHLTIDWDAVGAGAEAVGSLISAVSLVVAALTLRREGSQWRAERLQQAEDRQAAERALASLITVAVRPSDDSSAVVTVANEGDRPVFEVHLRSAAGARPWRGGEPPGVFRRLDGGQDVAVVFRTRPGGSDVVRAEVLFLDVAGRWWHRRGRGAPDRVDEVEALRLLKTPRSRAPLPDSGHTPLR